MEDLFRVRWEARNREVGQEFLRVKQEMSQRNILPSSITIQNAHGVIADAFEQDRAVIVRTIIDHIKSTNRLAKLSDYEARAIEQLEARKATLEGSLEGNFANVIGSLNNMSMIAPFRTLDSVLEGSQQELIVELRAAIDEHNRTFGNSFADQLKTQFMNNPILAAIGVAAAGAVFVIGLLRLLGLISFGSGS